MAARPAARHCPVGTVRIVSGQCGALCVYGTSIVVDSAIVEDTRLLRPEALLSTGLRASNLRENVSTEVRLKYYLKIPLFKHKITIDQLDSAIVEYTRLLRPEALLSTGLKAYDLRENVSTEVTLKY